MASSLAEVDNERVIDESENELVGRVGDSGEAIDGTEMPRTGRKSCWSSSKHIRLLRAELSSHAPPAPGIGDAVVVFERRASVMGRGNVAGNGGSGNSAGMCSGGGGISIARSLASLSRDKTKIARGAGRRPRYARRERVRAWSRTRGRDEVRQRLTDGEESEAHLNAWLWL